MGMRVRDEAQKISERTRSCAHDWSVENMDNSTSPRERDEYTHRAFHLLADELEELLK